MGDQGRSACRFESTHDANIVLSVDALLCEDGLVLPDRYCVVVGQPRLEGILSTSWSVSIVVLRCNKLLASIALDFHSKLRLLVGCQVQVLHVVFQAVLNVPKILSVSQLPSKPMDECI